VFQAARNGDPAPTIRWLPRLRAGGNTSPAADPYVRYPSMRDR
jgi:hypothetical protein